MKINLQDYLNLSNMMILATKDSMGNPYTANIYFGYDPENYTCYFISRPTREHSKHIETNPNIAWSIVNTEKYGANNTDKKGLQFQGVGKILDEEQGAEIFTKIYNPRIGFVGGLPEGHRLYACIPHKVKIHDESDKDRLGKIIHF